MMELGTGKEDVKKNLKGRKYDRSESEKCKLALVVMVVVVMILKQR